MYTKRKKLIFNTTRTGDVGRVTVPKTWLDMLLITKEDCKVEMEMNPLSQTITIKKVK